MENLCFFGLLPIRMIKVNADSRPHTFMVFGPLCALKDRIEGFKCKQGRWRTRRRIYLAVLPGFGDVGVESLGINPEFGCLVGDWKLHFPLVGAMGADASVRNYCLKHGSFEGQPEGVAGEGSR